MTRAEWVEQVGVILGLPSNFMEWAYRRWRETDGADLYHSFKRGVNVPPLSNEAKLSLLCYLAKYAAGAKDYEVACRIGDSPVNDGIVCDRQIGGMKVQVTIGGQVVRSILDLPDN